MVYYLHQVCARRYAVSIMKQDELFDTLSLITLTEEDRRYLALSPLSPHLESIIFYSKTNLCHNKYRVYFDGNTIVKVINQFALISEDGCIRCQSYKEYDTSLATEDRKLVLPLTSRGKPKKLTASNIDNVTPFGCSFSFSYSDERKNSIYLSNPRANRYFPIGEEKAVQAIHSSEEFRKFMDFYIHSCREDYFEKLKAFKEAKKVTVKYKVGDIFRMEYDRTRYGYGIITGDIKKIKAKIELPENHSLGKLMCVPIMVRYYQLLTEDPALTAEDLAKVPLGRLEIASDGDIIWGTHTIVDHKPLTEEDLEFHFNCCKIVEFSKHFPVHSQDFNIQTGFFKKAAQSLYVKWGFAQTILPYEELPEKLKERLKDYSSPHGGVDLSICPDMCVPEDYREFYAHKNNLLNPHNREFLNEIFACIGLGSDATFDDFAAKFGGLTKKEILARLQ